MPKKLVYPKGPFNSEFKGVGTIVHCLKMVPQVFNLIMLNKV